MRNASANHIIVMKALRTMMNNTNNKCGAYAMGFEAINNGFGLKLTSKAKQNKNASLSLFASILAVIFIFIVLLFRSIFICVRFTFHFLAVCHSLTVLNV